MKSFLNISYFIHRFLCYLVLFACLLGCYAPSQQVSNIRSPYFADSIPQLPHNLMTDKGIELGKALFFDKNLSGNGQIACATCHIPSLAFADTVALTNKGISGKNLLRNTPPLFNLAWTSNGLFWDGGVNNLESLSFAPLSHADEMGQDLSTLPKKLTAIPDYRSLFFETFGQDTITNAMIARALAQYLRTLFAENSRYDDFVQQKIQLDRLEIEGLNVFNKKCATCHLPPLFTDNKFHNIGLDSIIIADTANILLGRFRITQDSADIGKFKTPSLRNLAFTFPYMHDGRLRRLEDVLLHYQANMKKNIYLDTLFIQENNKVGIPLSPEEIKSLIAFLNTLNQPQW
ncbi:MAG: cytochrome-c peroxidase [Thermoflexibacter sp.]|jgi:cytochrome c peroxidase|nr:cytochrome-c peroxidase [Thermoflexibacter sp.]